MTPHFNDLDSSILQLGKSIKKDRGFQADSKLLLFSQRADWEPVSYRGLTVGGRIIDLFKLEDYEAYGKRVYRVGVSLDLLHPWMRLKRLCGAGGAVRNGVIEIQGDHRERLVEELCKLGLEAKRSGG